MRVILQFIIFILACFISKSNAQEAGLPTASEKASVKKNFPIIFQNIPTNFEKLKKGTATDYFGQQLFESSTMLLPENIGPIPQRIYYITEKDGKKVNTYNEELPFSAEVCIELLDPLLKQNGLIEVAPVRADSNMVTKSFKGKSGVVIFSVNPFTHGTIITIGKPYYYYAAESKPLTAKTTLPDNKNNNGQNSKPLNNTAASKRAEEKIFTGLTKLYLSAINQSGSFEELKKGASEKSGNATIYEIAGRVQLDSVLRAKLVVASSKEAINGVLIEITPVATLVYIKVINKLAATTETSGEVLIDKKKGLTKYSVLSKSLKKEIMTVLDFDNSAYNDVIICNTIIL